MATKKKPTTKKQSSSSDSEDYAESYKYSLRKELSNPANIGRSQATVMRETYANMPKTETQRIMSQTSPEFKAKYEQEVASQWKLFESRTSPSNPNRISRSSAEGSMLRSLTEFIRGGGLRNQGK